MLKSKNSIGYSLALFSIAKEENKVKEYFNDAKILLSLFSNPELSSFINIIDSQTINIKEKEKIIDLTFKSTEKNFLSFLKLLALKNHFKSIKNILSIFIKYCCENLKIKEGILYSSSLLSIAQVKKIEEKISLNEGYKVNLKNLLDKELISGIKIVIGNTIIENSLMLDLEEIKKILKGIK